MLPRTALALLLLLPAAASGQDLDTAVSGLVRISGTRGGTPVRGSGFVVAFDGGRATIITASHVIQGVQQLKVTFAVDPAESFPAGALLGLESDNPRGLAVFEVRGALPAGVITLGFETEVQPHLSETLFLSGFPSMKTMPLTVGRNFAGPSGDFLQLDGTVGEGFSGAPVLRKGNVVGVVTEEDSQITYAVKALVVRDRVGGWGVKVVEKCEPGKERTEAGIVWVRICPGTFTMGAAENDRETDEDENPAHQVTLSEFWIGKTEVTNEQYRRFHPEREGEADLPVTRVRWDRAKAACEHFGGRLPTEAEWEYAARAGSQTVWSFGNHVELLSAYAWYDEKYEPFYVKMEKQQEEYRKWVEGPKRGPPPLHIVANSAKSVGTKKPNTWGLHDMHGNAWEWVADWYGAYPAEVQIDPAGPPTGKYRAMRGGSINSASLALRSAHRGAHEPSGWDGGWDEEVGFRCARSPRP